MIIEFLLVTKRFHVSNNPNSSQFTLKNLMLFNFENLPW